MHECVARCLTEIEALKLLDNLLVKCGSLQEVHQVVVECGLRIGRHVLLSPLWQINQEDGL